ncbi:MAG: DUF4192 family protein, partial [Actinomycetes bacterium]
LLPERSALGALVAGPPAEDLDRLLALAEDSRAALPADRVGRQGLMAQLVEEYLGHPRALTDEECLRFAVLGEDVHVRDVAWIAITRREADAHQQLWQQVVARAVPPFESAPVCLLGIAAWIAGNGVLTNFCIDKMADLDPDYTMTEVLADLVTRALPPWLWEDIRSELQAEGGRLAG